MNMNTGFVRTLALFAALAAIGPIVVRAETTTPRTAIQLTEADKAEQAKRLAATAAELAQRAAQLAAESKAPAPAPAAAPGTGTTAASTAWSPRAAAVVEITDADESATDDGALQSGWRRYRKPAEAAIRFMNDPTPLTSRSAIGPAIISPANSTTSPVAPGHKTPPLADQAAPPPSAATETESDDTVAARKPLSDANIRLAASAFQSDDAIVPDTEPLPPAPSYTERNGSANGKGAYEGSVGTCACGSGCAAGCCDCCNARPMLFWNSGIEATYLFPDLNNDGVGFEVVEFASERADFFSTVTDETDSGYFAPRIWFGVQGCKWGVNFRYWHLQAGEGSYDPTLGSNGEWDGPNCGTPNFGYTSCTHLEAYYLDLEVTRRFCLNDCQMQFSGGVRHADVSYDELLNATALTDDSQVFGYGSAHRETRGTGVVFGWYGRRPVFPCSCVHWFYNVRGSVVWGPTQTASETGVMLTLTSTDPDAVAAAGSVNGASTYVDDDLWIGEFQVGLEWDYALQCMPANAFCRLALEYQRWTGGIGYSAAESFAGVEIDDDPTTLAAAFASAAAPEMDLLGIAVSAGLTW